MNPKNIQDVFSNVVAFSQKENWTGYNKFDGLESPLFRALSFHNKWIKLAFSQLVMRAPINLRPLLGIPKLKNAKGFALYSMALIDMYQFNKDPACLTEAKTLLDWLVENPSPGFDAPCWGYPFGWQDIGFYAPPNFPNRVVTCFVCNALMKGYRATKQQNYLDTVRGCTAFLTKAPKVLYESGEMKCLSYVPSEKINWVVMDVSVLTGAVLASVYRETGEAALAEEAKKLVHYVVDKQTPEGAWFYSHPAKDSHIGHDNYHTGFILDAIESYMRDSGDSSYREVHEKGLAFYSDKLFLENGAPRWMSSQTYPLDIHGAAQGIITFSKIPKYRHLATKTLEWTLKNLYHPEGRFYYQKRKFFTKKFTLMRWCNGWMLRAIGAWFASSENAEG